MKRLERSGDIPVLSAPVEGVWRVVNSPGHARFAYDLAAVNLDTGSTLRKPRLAHIFGQAAAKDSYSWGKPVKSPVAGTVADVSDEAPDRDSLNLILDLARMLTARPDPAADGIRPFAGNYVILDAEDFYVFVAHMRSGSVRVAAGDRVKVGQVLGEVGNSGFTLEPYLHIQLFDQVDDIFAANAPPFKIDTLEVMTNGVWNVSPNGILPKGELVRFN
jgi:murein DD-endopeptidase MepM/ murein hydrolase activator NlpD